MPASLGSVGGGGFQSGNVISTTSFNSRDAATLAAGATFQGVGEDVSAFARVGVAITSSNATDGTLTMEVSHDNVTWGGPTRTWSDTRFGQPHMWNIVEKYFRIKYVNGTTEANDLAIQVQYSNNADILLAHQLDETLKDETESLIVRSVGVAQDPVGTYTNSLNDGLGFSTSSLLTNGATYDSTVLSLVGYTQVQTDVLSDVNGTIVIDFIRDSGGTDILRTLTIPYLSADGYQFFSAPAFTPYVRYRFTAVEAGQTDFYFDTKFLTKSLSAQILGVDSFISPAMTASLARNVLVGKTPSGSYENVGVTNQRALRVSPPHEGKTAFGEALVGQLVDQVILDFAYGLNTDIVTTRENQSGAITAANSLAIISSGASANSGARILSKEICRYVPGHGARARFTSVFTTGVAGNTQTSGIGDTSNGFFFGYNGTSFGILHRRDGKPEVRTLTVSTASSTAEDITITLDSDATATVTVTNSANTTTTANEIAAHDYSDVGNGWTAKAIGSTVVFESWSSETQSGTYSLSSASTAVGTFAQNVVGTAPTETWTAQANWNGEETFNGNGITGSTIDPTKGNVFQVDYQWLGFGAIYFYIEDSVDGELHLVHTIRYANENTTPSLSIPSQPFTVASINTSNTTDVSVSLSSAGCFVDGTVEFIGPRKAVAAAKDFGAANAELPILSVENKVHYQSNINRIAAKGIAISAASTGGKSVTWKILKNATLTSASFSDLSANNSVLQKDTSATTYSGGTEIAAFATGAGSSVIVNSGDNNDLIVEPGETITITADPTANNSDVSVSIRFIELF